VVRETVGRERVVERYRGENRSCAKKRAENSTTNEFSDRILSTRNRVTFNLTSY